MPSTRLSRRSFRPTNAGSRRAVSWSAGPRGDQAVSANGAVLFPTTVEANIDDLTIVRTRGQLLVVMREGSSVNAVMNYAFGMCVVSQNAAGIGITAVPTPFTDIAWDGWFLHTQGVVHKMVAADTGSPDSIDRVNIDSKAMRKIHATDTIIAVIEFHGEQATADVQAFLESRIFSKLP